MPFYTEIKQRYNISAKKIHFFIQTEQQRQKNPTPSNVSCDAPRLKCCLWKLKVPAWKSKPVAHVWCDKHSKEQFRVGAVKTHNAILWHLHKQRLCKFIFNMCERGVLLPIKLGRFQDLYNSYSFKVLTNMERKAVLDGCGAQELQGFWLWLVMMFFLAMLCQKLASLHEKKIVPTWNHSQWGLWIILRNWFLEGAPLSCFEWMLSISIILHTWLTIALKLRKYLFWILVWLVLEEEGVILCIFNSYRSFHCRVITLLPTIHVKQTPS